MSTIESLKTHLDELDAFLGSSAFAHHQDGLKESVRLNEKFQVEMPLVSLEDLFELMQLKGEHRCLTERLAVFEDARVSLSDRLDEMVEAQLENATERKI